MRILLGAAMVLTLISPALARGGHSFASSHLSGTGSNPNSHYVAPHFNSRTGYTSGHFQTNPNRTQMDNYGTRGNFNPHTGAYGTLTPHY